MVSRLLSALQKTSRYTIDTVTQKSFLLALLTAVLSWSALAFCYPPYTVDSFWLPPTLKGLGAFAVLFPFLVSIYKRSYREVALISFVAGFIHNALIFYWLKHVMDSGDDVYVVVGIGMFLLMSYLASYALFLGLAFRFLYKRRLIWLFPLVWIGLELVKTKGEISLPWAHLGYTLGGYQVLLQGLAYIGIFGYSALIITVNIFWFRFWVTRKVKYVCYSFVPVVLLAVSGYAILHNQKPAETFADVVVAQPSIIQKEKWIKRKFNDVINRTLSTVDSIVSDSADLIVFPETAIPAYLKNVSRISRQIQQMAYDKHANIIIGALDYEQLPSGSIRSHKIFNSGFLFSRDSSQAIRKYDKHRLVPFSERLPWEDVIPAIQYLNMGEGDFTAGTESPVWDSIGFSPQICFEVVYPYFVRNAIRGGAKMIVVMTNDAWFKHSTQPFQHANLLRYRAIENGISIVQSANTGISVFYDSYGTILGQTEWFQQMALRRQVPLKNRTTLYSVVGDFIEDTFFGLFLIFCMWAIWSIWLRLKPQKNN